MLPLHFPLITSPAHSQHYGHLHPFGLPCCLPWLEKAIPATMGNIREKELWGERPSPFSSGWDVDEGLLIVEELSYSPGLRSFVLTCCVKGFPCELDNISCSVLWEEVWFSSELLFQKFILNVWASHRLFSVVVHLVCVWGWECDIRTGNPVRVPKRSRLVPTLLKVQKGNTGFVKQGEINWIGNILYTNS